VFEEHLPQERTRRADPAMMLMPEDIDETNSCSADYDNVLD